MDHFIQRDAGFWFGLVWFECQIHYYISIQFSHMKPILKNKTPGQSSVMQWVKPWCWHLIWLLVQVPPVPLQSSSLLRCLGKQRKVTQLLGPLHHMRGPEEASGLVLD